jgi:hypothetical protein
MGPFRDVAFGPQGASGLFPIIQFSGLARSHNVNMASSAGKFVVPRVGAAFDTRVNDLDRKIQSE